MSLAELASQLGGATTPLRGIRRAAARQMARAWEAPMFSLSVAVDMTDLLAREDEGVTVTDRIVDAVAACLVAHRDVNAWYAEEGVTRFDRAHVGLAVATDDGLVVPVIRDAQRLGLAGIAAARADLVRRARSKELSLDDMSGATFTISNLGMMGVDRFTAIVNPPQTAILAIGATTERFVRWGDGGTWRRVADVTLSCDHRVLDGATAAAFLRDLRARIEAR